MKCTKRTYQLHIENVGLNPCANNLWGRSSNHSHTTWPSNKYSISKDIISLCMAIGWQHGWMHTHITAASILSLTYDWVAVVIWILLDVRLYECAAASQPHHRDHSQLKLIQNQTLDWFWEPCSRETTVYVCYAFTFSLTFLKSVFCLRCCVYCSKSIDCTRVCFYIYIYILYHNVECHGWAGVLLCPGSWIFPLLILRIMRGCVPLSLVPFRTH